VDVLLIEETQVSLVSPSCNCAKARARRPGRWKPNGGATDANEKTRCGETWSIAAREYGLVHGAALDAR